MAMRRALVAILSAASLAAAAGAAPPLSGRSERPATVSYGSDAAQRLDFHPARGTSGAAPLILFVHGGGWTNGSKDNATGRHMAPHYTGLGYNFATIDYRLVPDATVEQQAQDVADALKQLLGSAGPLGIDRGKVVLMGHSAGAHLVALVGTDPQYLRRAGLSYRDISGVIPLDGAAYHVAEQMEQSRLPLLKRRYNAAFGTDPARQRSLSPTHQAAAPNAASWLIVHVDRADGRQQSQDLARALQGAGAQADLREFAGKGMKGHMEINRKLGDPGYAATDVVDRWLEQVFGGESR
jgi:arylformamidase